MKWYIENLWNIMTRPIQFFDNMPAGTWMEAPLTFSLITGWIMAFALTFVVFINNYLPTGLSLIEGIAGKKLIITVPVLAVMGVAFFIMTVLIIGGMIIAAILGLFFVCAAILNFLLILLGGSGNIFDVIKACLFSSGAILSGILNILLMIAVKYKAMSFGNWITGERVVFYCTAVFLYGIFSIIGRKMHKVERWKAFLAATVPLILLVLFNIVFSAKILPKMEGILS